MAGALRYRVEQLETGPLVRVEGRLERGVAGELSELLQRLVSQPAPRVALDLSAVDEVDSAAVAVLVQASRLAAKAGGGLRLTAASEHARRALAMFKPREPPAGGARPAGGLESLGGAVSDAAGAFRDFLQTAADASAAVLWGVVRPKTVRWSALTEQAVFIGSQALPIIGLISFLVGLTLAFQSAHQLSQFGAAIFVANLTGVAMIREMGPLMTAILVAGRSGSSIAAEISTMKVSEEIDALQVMGMDPIRFLAVPRLLAITITLPLLTVFADLLGILGGFVVGIFYLDIAPVAFLNQMLEALGPQDLLTGLVKSVAFAWGIGLIGLFYGFRVQGGAAEVGRTTTSSVVASIFYIIVADCFFSVVFYILI